MGFIQQVNLVDPRGACVTRLDIGGTARRCISPPGYLPVVSRCPVVRLGIQLALNFPLVLQASVSMGNLTDVRTVVRK